MAPASADAYYAALIEAARSWDERREAALVEVRELVADIYERYEDISFPGGGILDHLRDEVMMLAEQTKPISSRRRSKRRLPGRLRKEVFERDAYRCVGCGSWVDLTIDHRIPESRGGTDDLDNLQTMCADCNSRKGVRVG